MSAALSATAQQLAQALEQHIAAGKLEVPMLPEVASKAVRLSQDEDADAAQGQHAALEAALGPAPLRGRLLRWWCAGVGRGQ